MKKLGALRGYLDQGLRQLREHVFLRTDTGKAGLLVRPIYRKMCKRDDGMFKRMNSSICRHSRRSHAQWYLNVAGGWMPSLAFALILSTSTLFLLAEGIPKPCGWIRNSIESIARPQAFQKGDAVRTERVDETRMECVPRHELKLSLSPDFR